MPPTQLPDLWTEEEVGEARNIGILRHHLMTFCPDVNRLLGNNLVLSPAGWVSVCLGTTDYQTLIKAGYQA